MNKAEILEYLREKLRAELAQFEKIAKDAHAAATHGEVRAEGKYDTQAIEAGYLAGAQAKRVEEIREDLVKLELLTTEAHTHVTLGSLVELEGKGWFFVSPTAGGGIFESGGVKVKIVSNSSPLGRELLGLAVGDGVEVQTPSGIEDAEILNVK